MPASVYSSRAVQRVCIDRVARVLAPHEIVDVGARVRAASLADAVRAGSRSHSRIYRAALCCSAFAALLGAAFRVSWLRVRAYLRAAGLGNPLCH